MSGTTITLPKPPVCTIDATGIHVPAFQDILAYFTTGYQAIYGADVYLGNDSQDGELIGLLAQSYSDANVMAVAAYNSFSPMTAQGTGLSSVVKINGIARLTPTNSTVDLTVVGVAGTVLTNAVAGDGTYRWTIPSVSVPGGPDGGFIIVTATCQSIGAISAPAGTITQILTPTAGWQSVTNVFDATLGQPVETDQALTQRQTSSTMLPSVTVLDGIVGAVKAITDVVRVQPYENDTDATDSNGIPSHSISLVVDGGDILTIANEIAAKKAPGSGTYGTQNQIVVDQNGVPHNISFFRPTEVTITIVLTLHTLTGYTTIIENNIKQSVVDYINSLAIGQSVYLSRVYVPANLQGSFAILTTLSDPSTYELLSVALSRPAATSLNGAISNNSITTIDVHGYDGFPLLSTYVIQVNSEQMLVTGGQGTTVWVVTRGYNGTTAATHLDGATVSLMSSAADVILAFNEAAKCAIGNVTVIRV